MSRAGDDGLGATSDDDLIEVQVSQTRSNGRRNRLEDLLNARIAPSPRTFMNLQLPSPAGGTRPAGSSSSSSAHHARRPTPAAPQNRSASQGPSRAQTSQQHPSSWRRPASRPPPQDTAVIDLTEEPDSPVQRRRMPPGQQQQQQQQHQHQHLNQQNNIGRNPRRTNSQRISPPQLARSDSTFMAPQASFIDLTADSPEDEGRAVPDHWRSGRHHSHQHHHHHHHRHVRPRLGTDQLIQLELLQQPDFASVFGRTLAGFLNVDFIRGGIPPPPGSEAAAREDSPKPPMEPAPPTRDGFTRNTCADADQEQVVVCPACNEELAYDPTGSATQTKKRKRAPGEHHFWALKKCGHVYCAECFENRRPTKASPNGAGFPVPAGRIPFNSPNEIRCAVEGCDTKVAAKTEWIGIYL